MPQKDKNTKTEHIVSGHKYNFITNLNVVPKFQYPSNLNLISTITDSH